MAALAAGKAKWPPHGGQGPVPPEGPPPRQLLGKGKAPPPEAGQGQGAEHSAALPQAREAAPSRWPRPRSPVNAPRQPQGKAKAPPPKAAQGQGAEHLAALLPAGATASSRWARPRSPPQQPQGQAAFEPWVAQRSTGEAVEAEGGRGQLPSWYGNVPQWPGQPKYNVWGLKGTFVTPGYLGEEDRWIRKGYARYPHWPFAGASSGPQQQQHHPQQHPRQQHPSPTPSPPPPPTAPVLSSSPPPPPPGPNRLRWNGGSWTLDGAPPPPPSAPAPAPPPPPPAPRGTLLQEVSQRARNQNDSHHMAQSHDGDWRLSPPQKERRQGRMGERTVAGAAESSDQMRPLPEVAASADAPEDKSSGQWASRNAESLNSIARDAQERRSGDGGAPSWLDERGLVSVGCRFSNRVMMILGRPVVVPGYFSIWCIVSGLSSFLFPH